MDEVKKARDYFAQHGQFVHWTNDRLHVDIVRSPDEVVGMVTTLWTQAVAGSKNGSLKIERVIAEGPKSVLEISGDEGARIGRFIRDELKADFDGADHLPIRR